ncbi:MAG TPA: hypothetical protein VFF69_08180 [Phycisphaerales bacterium]|nr:hypothetical protein [Phycisphaerales bacterium]
MTPACRSVVLCACLVLPGCYALHSSEGGGQTREPGAREVNPADVALPAGYRIDAVATGLTFPTGVAFDDAGVPHVVESGYSYGEVWTTARLLRLETDGSLTELATGENGPWNGLAFHEGAFYIAEGGQKEGGRILRVGPEGRVQVVVDGLPSLGDHHTNGPAIGPDGFIYFGQGTATNAGVVGKDNADFGWLARHPEFHDVPAFDVTLAGRNFTGPDAIGGSGSDVTTGAFLPYGTPSEPGQVIRGNKRCTGAVLRVAPSGSGLEVVAWGLRNPFGLAFDEAGRLFVTENSYDERGSRPVWGTGDVLWEVDVAGPPAWYGWPDFHADQALTDPDRYAPRGGEPQPGFLLAEHPGTPPAPAAVFGVHASANGLDFSTSDAFGHRGEAFVAQFGDMSPPVGKVMGPVGFKVVRVEPASGVVEEFAVNRSGQGPASKVGGGGLERPVAVRFSPGGEALYVVDFGILTSSEQGHSPREGTGVLWRITRGETP